MKILRFFIGINIMAIGVALSKLSQLGTSPIAAIPNVLSEILKQSIGLYTILFMVLLVIIQIIILGIHLHWSDLFKLLIQIIPGALFGFFINFYVNLLEVLTHFNSYIFQLTILLISIIILAIGVVIEVRADFILMPGEGLPQSIAKHFNLSFPKVKLWSDFTMVFVALVISFLLSQPFLGIREGTLLATLLTGPCVSLITYYLEKMKTSH
ncbi:YczE/YyaS/YitT family protein [Streptococcus catagoni]|uniref:YczE/YyaS/YitT family protein n=1 Tax=Streptococcus catagoni TaxID=2654874 RepID=UPI00140AE510|nr:DUF6198 family protein [Streptococcus catagoni]